MMSVDVTTEIVIRRPLAEVAEYASNPDNAPAWYTNIKRVDWVTKPPLEVGSRIAFVAQFLGRTLSYTYEVAELTQNVRFVMRTAEGPFPMETTYTWESVPGGTCMSLRNRGNPSGFSRLFAPFMAFAMRKANQKDLAALRAIFERNGD